MLPLTRFFHPVLASSALRADRPVSVRIGDRAFAVFRDAGGAPAAVADLCPHRNASLSGAGRVREGRIVCGYHGWSFDSQGAGRCLSQPSLQKCDTESFQVVERSGYLWLADRGVAASLLPALGWTGFELAGSFTHLFECPLRTALDNFSEDEHFPAVHSMLGWDASGLSRVEFAADNFDDRTEVRYAGPQRPHPMLRVFGVEEGGAQRCSSGRREVAADTRIVRHVRPLDSLDGLRLTKFDKPVIHNRKLLDAIYFGAPAARISVVRGEMTEQR
jgi:phenylpropionate dioxygenase-like ring-hydroxylating dioxygenase large terminal subunit